MSVLMVRIPHTPGRELSPNGRAHPMARYRASEAAKTAAYYAAREAVGLDRLADPVACLQTGGPVRLDWLIRWGKGRKRMDDDNAIASCKAYRDGIAELLGMDDRRFVQGRMAQDRDPDGLGYTLVTLTEDGGQVR